MIDQPPESTPLLRKDCGTPGTSELLRYPYWDEFVQSIRELNNFVTLKCLRRYQASILDDGTFEIVSPFSGTRIQTGRSLSLSGRIAYLFPQGPRFWLVTGAFQHGNPLAAFFSEHDHRTAVLTSHQPPVALKPEHLLTMKAAQEPRISCAGTELIVGHSNFAHHLWNELPALDQWLSYVANRALSKVVVRPTAQPFGPLEQIFPRLKLARFESAIDKPFDESHLAVRPGSRLISSHLREVIVAHCKTCTDQVLLSPILARLRNGEPKVWISVRIGSRTPENQMDFLLALLGRIFDEYRDAVAVFDGFSFPIGFFQDRHMVKYREEFANKAACTADFIAELRDRAVATLGASISSRLCSVSGLSLAEAAYVGSACSYYICHAGTLQHKIAWLHNIAGLIHSPPIGNPRARAQWYADQLEGGVPPDILPERFVVATEISSNVRDVSRNSNYRITNVPAAVDSIMQSMLNTLAH